MPAIKDFAFFVDIMLGQVTGRVTATQRSSDMAHRFSIDAVHIQTSTASQMRHQTSPNIQTCHRERGEERDFNFVYFGKYSSLLTLNTSQVAENGSTARPTSKSATAKLTMKKLVTLRNLFEQKTAAITRQLPPMTKTLMNSSMAREIRFAGSVHFTDLMRSSHSVSFMAVSLCLWPCLCFHHLQERDKESESPLKACSMRNQLCFQRRTNGAWSAFLIVL